MSGARVHVKLVTVGDIITGKTPLVIRYIKGTFPSEWIPTVFDYWTDHKVVDGTNVDIEVVDVSGYEDYARLWPMVAYPGTDVVLLCFAIDTPSSFANVKERWCPELGHHCPGTPILLVGTKEDLRDDPVIVGDLATKGLSTITYQQGLECARNIGAVKYMECSALTNKGVQEVFLEAVMIALRVREAAELHRNSRRCILL